MPAGALTVSARWPMPVKTYICIRGRPPSAGVDMLALSVPLKSWASALMLSAWIPPRPKLLVWALRETSLKPES